MDENMDKKALLEEAENVDLDELDDEDEDEEEDEDEDDEVLSRSEKRARARRRKRALPPYRRALPAARSRRGRVGMNGGQCPPVRSVSAVRPSSTHGQRSAAAGPAGM